MHILLPGGVWVYVCILYAFEFTDIFFCSFSGSFSLVSGLFKKGVVLKTPSLGPQYSRAASWWESLKPACYFASRASGLHCARLLLLCLEGVFQPSLRRRFLRWESGATQTHYIRRIFVVFFSFSSLKKKERLYLVPLSLSLSLHHLYYGDEGTEEIVHILRARWYLLFAGGTWLIFVLLQRARGIHEYVRWIFSLCIFPGALVIVHFSRDLGETKNQRKDTQGGYLLALFFSSRECLVPASVWSVCAWSGSLPSASRVGSR